MAKWSGNYLIAFVDLSDPDANAQQIIWKSAMAYAVKYRVPREHRLTNDEILSGMGMFTHLAARSNILSSCTLDNKLMLIAHGSSKTVDAFDASKLASQLVDWGLREIGLITFKACSVGKGFYLEQFLLYLGKKNVRVDWLKGYTGAAITEFEPNPLTEAQRNEGDRLIRRLDRAMERVERVGLTQGADDFRHMKAQFPETFAKFDRSMHRVSDFAVSMGAKVARERILGDDDKELTGSDRYRIVRGNAAAGERGRYVFKTLGQGLRTRDDFAL